MLSETLAIFSLRNNLIITNTNKLHVETLLRPFVVIRYQDIYTVHQVQQARQYYLPPQQRPPAAAAAAAVAAAAAAVGAPQNRAADNNVAQNQPLPPVPNLMVPVRVMNTSITCVDEVVVGTVSNLVFRSKTMSSSRVLSDFLQYGALVNKAYLNASVRQSIEYWMYQQFPNELLFRIRFNGARLYQVLVPGQYVAYIWMVCKSNYFRCLYEHAEDSSSDDDVALEEDDDDDDDGDGDITEDDTDESDLDDGYSSAGSDMFVNPLR